MGFELIPIPFVRKAGLCIRRFKMNVRFCRISGVRSSLMQSSPRLGAASTSTSGSGQHRPQGSQPCRTLLRLTQRLITGTSHWVTGRVRENAHRAAVMRGWLNPATWCC